VGRFGLGYEWRDFVLYEKGMVGKERKGKEGKGKDTRDD